MSVSGAAEPPLAETLDAALDALADYYGRLLRGPLGRPARGPDPSGLARIDAAIADIEDPATLQGLVGVRLGLYPDASLPGDASARAQRQAAA